MHELRFELPPSLIEGLRPGPGGVVHDDPFTRARAALDGRTLVTPLPRAWFHALELQVALGLPPAFLEAFDAANRAASAGSTAPRLDRARGEAWWRWTRSRGALRHAWPAADILIPDLLLWRRRDSNEVVRVMVWPDDAPSVLLPEAADLVVVRPRLLEGGAPLVAPTGLASRATTLALLGERARRFEEPVPFWRYNGGAPHRAVVAKLWAAADARPAELAPSAPDQVVDA